ncbi:MAG: hypothetical protein IPO27_03925 [Bacteroidetes bacterium]|nr:hypothetical protein [Bacteroidota bacterium]
MWYQRPTQRIGNRCTKQACHANNKRVCKMECADVRTWFYTCSVVAGATSYTWTVPYRRYISKRAGTNSITVHFGNTFTGSGFITVKANNICGSSNVRSYFVGGKLPTPVISGLNWACPDSIRTYTIAPITGATSYTWTVVPGSTLISGQGTTSITVKWGYINGVIQGES